MSKFDSGLFGNNLRDEVLQYQLDNNVGGNLESWLSEDQSTLHIVLKSKSGREVGSPISVSVNPTGNKVLNSVEIIDLKDDSDGLVKKYLKFNFKSGDPILCNIYEIYQKILEEKDRAEKAEQSIATDLTTLINDEIARAGKVEESLTAQLNLKASAADLKTVQNNLKTEISDRKLAVATVTGTVSSLQVDIQTMDTKLSGVYSLRDEYHVQSISLAGTEADSERKKVTLLVRSASMNTNDADPAGSDYIRETEVDLPFASETSPGVMSAELFNLVKSNKSDIAGINNDLSELGQTVQTNTTDIQDVNARLTTEISARTALNDTVNTLNTNLNKLAWLSSIPAPPSMEGTYSLKCSVASDGTVTYSWEN